MIHLRKTNSLLLNTGTTTGPDTVGNAAHKVPDLVEAIDEPLDNLIKETIDVLNDFLWTTQLYSIQGEWIDNWIEDTNFNPDIEYLTLIFL